MKRSNKVNFILLIIVCCLFITKERVHALTATTSFSGTNEVNAETVFTEDIVVSGIDGSITGIEGRIISADSSCVEILSLTQVDTNTTIVENKFSYFISSGISDNITLARVTFRSGSNACETAISISEQKITFVDGTSINPEAGSKRVTVIKEEQKSSDATLKKLVPNVGSLSPSFSRETLLYTLEVPQGTEMVIFDAEVNQEKAQIQEGNSCSLTSNETLCKMIINAEDDTTNTYEIIVKRPNTEEPKEENPNENKPNEENPNEIPSSNPNIPLPSADATLKVLDISGFSLNPTFKSNIINYSITVPNNITGLNINALANDPQADIKITGASGWKEGINPVTITVTAQDGTKKIYTINANRKTLDDAEKEIEEQEETDNYLKSLTLSDGDLNPSFDKEISHYSISVSKNTSSVKVTAIPDSKVAEVKVEGNQYLKIGNNTILITVTAKDGSKRTYTINVYRSNEEGDNLLENIIIDGYTLSPAFDPTHYEYEVTVGNIEEIEIKAIAKNKNAKVEIVGNKGLEEGRNAIQIKVTDEKGFTKTYFLYVNKNAKKVFFGLTLGQWGTIIGCLLLVGILIYLLWRTTKKKNKLQEKKVEQHQIPKELKPEFNFGSSYGVEETASLEEDLNRPAKEQFNFMAEKTDEVTKDALFDAIEEARKTKDPTKFKMLYEQELQNRKKEELKSKEQEIASAQLETLVEIERL